MPDSERVFQVRESSEGEYEARAVGYSIFTQGNDWDDLKYMMRDAVLCHLEDGKTPGPFVSIWSRMRPHPCENTQKSIWQSTVESRGLSENEERSGYA